MTSITTYPKKAGIYKLTCLKNGKIYIGKSVNIYYRISCHKSCGKKSKGRYLFENAIIKHGWDAFSVEILETFNNFDKTSDFDKQMIIERESFYIQFFNSTDQRIGYNICRQSTDRTGIRNSEESKKRMSDRQKGRKLSEETREKIRQSKLGKKGTPHSEETKNKLRQLNLGKKLSEETKQKIKQKRLGTTASEETKLKIKQRMLGNSYALGIKHTEETKEKCRLGKLKKKNFQESDKESDIKLDALIDVSLNNVAKKNIEVKL